MNNLPQNQSLINFALFIILVLLFGFMTILAQVVFLREFLVIAYGNELYLAVIFTCWFLGITLGAFIAGMFADKLSSPVRVLILLLLFQAILAPLNCFLIRELRLIFTIPAGEIFPLNKFFVASAVIIIPFTFLTGVNFPLFCRCLTFYRPATPSTGVGIIYGLESVGSIVAGLGFSFWLVHIFPPFRLLIALAVIVFAVVMFLQLNMRHLFPKTYLTATIISFILISIFYFLPLSSKVESWSIQRRWQSLATDIKLLDSIDTKYQNLTISLQAGQYNIAADGKFIAVFPDEYGIPPLLNLVFCQVPYPPRRVLFIGSGNPELIHYALLHNPERIDYVELDEAMIPFLLPYLRPEVKRSLFDKRVFIHTIDGRYFIKYIAPRLHQTYDLIWINVPDPSTIALNRFYTREFYNELSQILAREGVMATQISSAVNYFGDLVLNYLSSVAKTISTIFPRMVVTPGERAFLFATNAPDDTITSESAVLIKRYNERQLQFANFSPLYFYTMLDKSQLQLVNRVLRDNVATQPINSDFRPLACFYNLALWANYSGIKANWLFAVAQRLRLTWLVFIAFIVLLLRLCYLYWRRPATEKIVRFNGLVLLGLTGFTAMAGEMIILFLFQSIFGYLYQKIGFIVGVFMLGLVIGSLSITKFLPAKIRNSIFSLVIIESIFLLFLCGLFFVTPALPKLSSATALLNETMFYLITLILGVLSGMEFPLVAHLLMQVKYKYGYSAAMVDSIDHLGAGIGAFATGLLIVPALGIAPGFLALAFIKLVGLLFLLFAPGYRIQEKLNT